MKTGQIIKIISNLYMVKTEEEIINCRACGKFRKEKITPLVGDYCEIDKENNYILKILPRKNFMTRPSIANVDAALIITSMKQPDYSATLLDKLISCVTLHHITPILCFTKLDLLEKQEYQTYQEIKKYYEKIGYTVVENQDISKIKKALANKIIVVTGQTGAGKSTLLNHLDGNLSLKTSPISEALNRGVHTTRHTEIFQISDFFIADTPGFSAIDITKFKKEEIKKSFIEFQLCTCRFKDCNHVKEPDCMVLKQVEDGKIAKTRYDSYLSLINEVEK